MHGIDKPEAIHNKNMYNARLANMSIFPASKQNILTVSLHAISYALVKVIIPVS